MTSIFSRLLLAVLGVATVGWLALQASSRWNLTRGTDSQQPSPPASSDTLHRIIAEGRVATYPGARIVLSSELDGVLTNIHVQETSRVQAGDLIAEIQADDTYASLQESRALVAELDSQIALANLEVQRGRALAPTGALTPQELDRLEKGLETFLARRTTAEVRVRRLEITMAKTRITAPFSGVILERHRHGGEVVTAGTPLVTLANLDRLRVEAEVDEYDAGRVQVGVPVVLRAEGHPGSWRGEVEEIPDRVGPRSLLPRDPAQPSDIRVLRVKIALREACPLKLDQRVEVEIRDLASQHPKDAPGNHPP